MAGEGAVLLTDFCPSDCYLSAADAKLAGATHEDAPVATFTHGTAI